MQTASLKIGTRSSKLALAQANETKSRLQAAHDLPDEAIEIVPMSTAGDRIQDRSLAEIGGKGLFTEEIEAALLSGKIDIAVHSTKDMPTQLPEGLHLSTFLPREDPRDAFISKKYSCFQDLPIGATVGSSSLRRQAMIRRLRPDIKVVTFRGNVQTRLQKLEDGQVDATFLACAGLHRLGMHSVITQALEIDDFIPAPGQGAIAIESRINDTRIDALLAPLADQPTETAILCERAFLASLDGSCRTPIAAFAKIKGDHLHFRGMILTPDGRMAHRIEREGSQNDAEKIGHQAAEDIRAMAGEDFFKEW